MPIDDLRKRLFRKNQDFSRRSMPSQLPKHDIHPPTSWEDTRTPHDIPILASRPTISWGRIVMRIFWIGIVVLVIGGGVYIWQSGILGIGIERNVSLEVMGGEEILAGRKVTWKVTYKNNNTKPLSDAALTFEFPEGAEPLSGEVSRNRLRERRELGTIQPQVSREEEFSAIVFGSEDAHLSGRAILEYRPEGSSARFTNDVDFSSVIKGTLLAVTFDIPKGLQAGQEADVKIKVVSSAENAFNNLWVGVEYPDAFEFVSASPKPERGQNAWLIGTLPAGGEYEVKLHGRIKKSENEETFHARIGVYDRIDDTWVVFNTATEMFSVSSSLLGVVIDVQEGEKEPGVVELGSRLTLTVTWRNTLPVAVHNVEIGAELDGTLLDLRTLESDFGEYDAGTHMVRWTPGRVPQLSVLEPGASGKLSFSVQLAKDASPKVLTDKNFSVRVRARITTSEIPPGYEGVDVSGKDEREWKIASNLAFTQKAYFNDSRIKNTGPLPPRVGQETTYLVVWSIVNPLNDMSEGEVRATMPSYITWKNIILPADASLTYQPTTGELVWKIGTIPAGTGYTRPVREVAFQIGLTPSLPQVHTEPRLVSKAILNATDTFTKMRITRESAEINTALKYDTQTWKIGGGSVTE